MAKNQKLRKTILDLKKKILKLEEESGGRILKLRRLYNRMLQGGAGFIPDIFKESFKKFDDLTTFLKEQKAAAKALIYKIKKMETVVESIGKVTVQYSGPSIPKEVKSDLDKNKDKCHNEVKEALEKCFSGTEDGTAGHFYTKLMEKSTDIEIQAKRELWIKSYAELLTTNVEMMDKSMKEYRNTVGEKVQEHSSSDSEISDEDVDDKSFGKTFEEHTNPKKGEAKEGEKGEAKEGEEAPKEGEEKTEESQESKEGEESKEGKESEDAPKESKEGKEKTEESKKGEESKEGKEGEENK